MQAIWEFIKTNWMIIGAIAIFTMVIIRTMIKNPKYKLKEILKNPLLIFKLFARATEETIDIITDIVDMVDDVKEITQDIDKKVDEAGKEIKDLKENIKEEIDNIKN